MKSFKPPSPLKEMPINHLNTTQVSLARAEVPGVTTDFLDRRLRSSLANIASLHLILSKLSTRSQHIARPGSCGMDQLVRLVVACLAQDPIP